MTQSSSSPTTATKPRSCGGCCSSRRKTDFLLWGSLGGVAALYVFHWQLAERIAAPAWLKVLAHTVFDLMNTVWWGIALGFVMIAILSKIPREFVMAAIGRRGSVNAIIRAAVGGVLLDLCSHGVLMVAAKLYERGASIGQVTAFLIASPWNSFSLTLILLALIGPWWTLAFIGLSLVIAIITGLAFERLVTAGVLPANLNHTDLPADFDFWTQAKSRLTALRLSRELVTDMLISGLRDSRMVVRWILFGILLAGLVRAFISPDVFGNYFGPTLAGLGLTLLAATVMEVCSEGSTPIASDLLTRAQAPGNSFAFLMAGVATDYTEIMVMKDTTKSWRIALFLPLLTIPQIVIIAYLMNSFG